MSASATLELTHATEPLAEGMTVESIEGFEELRSPRTQLFELALIVGWWAVWGIFMTGQYLAFFANVGAPVTVMGAAGRAYLGAGVWVIISIIAFTLARRFPLDRGPRVVPIAVHVLAGTALAFGEVVISFTVGEMAGWVSDDFVAHSINGFPSNLLYYWLLVGVGHGFNFHRRYRAREADAAKLQARLAQAELHLLKSQLHPHFLFNTLQAISTLMHRDAKAADRMLTRLSDLLRVALDYTGTQEVSLEEELAFLAPYLEIERVRLGERLSFELDVQPNVLDARVPHMILQPLVENAIRHGIAPRATPGHIFVSARGRRGMLDLEVKDDGPGVRPGRTTNRGLGLTITRARLEQMYGAEFSFEPRNVPEGGFRVSITIPFRPSVQAGDGSEVE
jgi:signal transduction histidine kinase